MDTGQPGALRLFIPPLSKEVSWLLPFGLLSVLLVAWRGPKRGLLPPLAVTQQSLVLWSGWLLTCVVFFSIAGFFHEYYLSMLAAPLAALVAAGAVRLWELRAQRPWLAAALLLVGAGVTLGFQVYTAQAFTNAAGWLPLTLAVFAAGALLLAGGTILRLSSPATAGFALVLLALFITPGVWSGLTAFAGGGSQTLPAAYGGASPGMPGLSRETFGADNPGGLQVDQGLLAYLEQNTAGMKYLMAVPSSMDGASYVLATGRPVLYMGGFNGQDPVVDATDLSNLVAAGQLRYIWGESRVGPGGQTGISAWVASQCTAVSGLSTAGGSSSAGRGGFDPSGGGRLYDCGH